MNQESLAQLAAFAQAGDDNALEQFLLRAYTPVSFLCRKLLKDSTVAQEQTLCVLQQLMQQLPTLREPELAEAWINEQAAAWCVRYQQENPTQQAGEPEVLSIAGQELDEMQTVDAVQQMVDMLPEKPRTCMTLLCCCEMKSAAIAQLTGFSVEEVRENMGIAQSFVLEQLQTYQELGTEFYPISSLADVLQSGMRWDRETEAAEVVGQILVREEPQPKEPANGKKVFLWVMVVVLIVVDLLLAGLNVLVKQKNTYDPGDYIASTVIAETAATGQE